MLAQIVADTLGMPYDAIEVNAADTAVVPDSGPTVASRTCMIVGRILQRCAEEMRARLGAMTPREYLRRTARSSSRSSTSGQRRWSGTTAVSGRRVWQLRLGLRCR